MKVDWGWVISAVISITFMVTVAVVFLVLEAMLV